MHLARGTVPLAAGVLPPAAAYHHELGQVGSGREDALGRRRLLTRGRVVVVGPVVLVLVLGVVVPQDHLSG